MLYRMIASGKFPPPVKLGRATRIVLAEVEQYIDQLMAERRHTGAWRGPGGRDG